MEVKIANSLISISPTLLKDSYSVEEIGQSLCESVFSHANGDSFVHHPLDCVFYQVMLSVRVSIPESLLIIEDCLWIGCLAPTSHFWFRIRISHGQVWLRFQSQHPDNGRTPFFQLPKPCRAPNGFWLRLLWNQSKADSRSILIQKPSKLQPITPLWWNHVITGLSKTGIRGRHGIG